VNKRGFLLFELFEVMISIVIITIALIFIARSYSSSKNSIRKSGEVIKALLYLENKMWEFEDTGEVEASTAEGSFDDKYTWKMTAEAMEDTELNLMRMEILKKEDKARYAVSTYLRNKKE
jgi:type II secretory pathway pseudopilin PulG